MKSDLTAQRAYLSLVADGAREWKTLAAMAADLRELKSRQKDHRATLMKARPKVVATADNEWRLEVELGGKSHVFREHAFEQFARQIGFPPTLLPRCPENLARENIGYFTFLGDRDVLWRAEGSEIRAVLSPEYVPVSHIEIVDRFNESGKKYDVNWAGVTEKRMFILAIDSDKFNGPDGSRLSHCTLVGNSETGEGTFFGKDLLFDHI